MNILNLTWKEIDALPKDKTVLFLTFAPIEEHGHHMPLGVDLLLGETWKNRAIEMLSEKDTDFNFLTMPPIPFAQGSIKGFPGSLHVKQTTVFRVAFEIIDKIAGWGIKNIVIIASHAEPKHLIAIEEACEKVNKKRGLCAISPMGAFFSYNELGIDLNFPEPLKEQLEKYPNDFHAGWIETSAILDIDESLVKKDFINLPDTNIHEKEMIFPGRVNKKIAGWGHIGFPRYATKELGKLININSAEYICRATLAFTTRHDYQKYQHHALYKNIFLRTNFLDWLISVGIIIGITAYLLFRYWPR